jgi:hypothetical protein
MCGIILGILISPGSLADWIYPLVDAPVVERVSDQATRAIPVVLLPDTLGKARGTFTLCDALPFLAKNVILPEWSEVGGIS